MMDQEDRFIRSSGNVFADMELPDPDGHLAKARIAAQVARLISERGMTQEQMATMIGVTQPQVSALMRGRWESISLDKLFQLLKALDTDISITLSPKRGDLARVTVGV